MEGLVHDDTTPLHIKLDQEPVWQRLCSKAHMLRRVNIDSLTTHVERLGCCDVRPPDTHHTVTEPEYDEPSPILLLPLLATVCPALREC